MIDSSFLAPLVNHRLSRRVADAAFVQLAHRDVRALDALDLAKVQSETLLSLIHRARDTRFGQDHGFAKIDSVADYQARVPVRSYEYFWEHYWKGYPDIADQTWPGFMPYFALSSGTTSGATKYIPVSMEMVKSNRQAARTTMALFRHAFPKHRIFTGQFFFLGGNTDVNLLANGARGGDLSGIAAREVPAAVRPLTFPPLELSRIPKWEEKMPRLAEAAAKADIVALSGVPSWMALLFDMMKKVTGKNTISEIWPNFRMLIHGGTKFDGYRDLFRAQIGGDAFEFCEVYPASEGFIATEDPRYKLLRLVPDHDIFFEFVPCEDFDSKGVLKEKPTRHTVREIEIGVRYAVVLTTCAGLWSYLIGDTVIFEKTDPPLMRFAGRTKNFLSAFGEHLIEEEVEKGIAFAAKACGVFTGDFHVGPVFPSKPDAPGFHRYLVEFRDRVPDLTEFAMHLDKELDRLNEDYAAHRIGDLTMTRPEVVPVKLTALSAWVEARKGSLDVQAKVPRMDNDGTLTATIFEWLKSNCKLVEHV
ncbi:MAG: GH3 auxin-responsive promoter family protein [Planctomycetia bacterium]|nr:GH3 auxin-responsive promoter family protein [Planctomycetia bacterium]